MLDLVCVLDEAVDLLRTEVRQRHEMGHGGHDGSDSDITRGGIVLEPYALCTMNGPGVICKLDLVTRCGRLMLSGVRMMYMPYPTIQSWHEVSGDWAINSTWVSDD